MSISTYDIRSIENIPDVLSETPQYLQRKRTTIVADLSKTNCLSYPAIGNMRGILLREIMQI